MRWESKLQASLRKHLLWWAFAAVLLLGALIRYSFMPLMVADMEFFYQDWFNAIRTGGMAAVFAPELQWSYSALHLYIWTLTAALFPTADAMSVLKGVCLMMEGGMIAAALLLLWQGLPKERRAFGMFAGFTLLWLCPVSVLNAAGWGQTDASYVALALLSLWLLLRDRPAWSMVAFGLAMGFKMQAVFLLPLLLLAWFLREKRFSLLWFLLIPAVWVATGVPMVLLGQSPLYAVTVYLGQTDLFVKATFNSPNLFALMGDALGTKAAGLGMWQRYGLALAMAALGGMAVWMIRQNRKLTDRVMLLAGAWCVLCCVFFLPRMHERYCMAGEILLLVWAVALWKPRGFVMMLWGWLPTVSAYCEYMFRKPIFSLQVGGFMNLVLLGGLTWELVQAVKQCPPMPDPEAAVAGTQRTPTLQNLP